MKTYQQPTHLGSAREQQLPAAAIPAANAASSTSAQRGPRPSTRNEKIMPHTSSFSTGMPRPLSISARARAALRTSAEHSR